MSISDFENINRAWNEDNEDNEEQAKKEVKKLQQQMVRDIANYRSNRVGMMTDIKKHRQIMDSVVRNGVKSPEEQRVAKIACCILMADLFVEDAIMRDKTGKMSKLLKSPDIIDDILGFNP